MDVSRIWISRLIVGLMLVAAAFAQVDAADRQQIRAAQRTLALLGLDPGPPDGVLGSQTKAALTRFQQAEGLARTGVLDPPTRTRLADREREHVRDVQKALKESGHDPGPLDGVLGDRTRGALRHYASAPPPASPTRASQLIDQFRQVYGPEPQSP